MNVDYDKMDKQNLKIVMYANVQKRKQMKKELDDDDDLTNDRKDFIKFFLDENEKKYALMKLAYSKKK